VKTRISRLFEAENLSIRQAATSSAKQSGDSLRSSENIKLVWVKSTLPKLVSLLMIANFAQRLESTNNQISKQCVNFYIFSEMSHLVGQRSHWQQKLKI